MFVVEMVTVFVFNGETENLKWSSLLHFVASNNSFDLQGVCSSLTYQLFCQFQSEIVFGACHLVVITFGLLLMEESKSNLSKLRSPRLESHKRGHLGHLPAFT